MGIAKELDEDKLKIRNFILFRRSNLFKKLNSSRILSPTFHLFSYSVDSFIGLL